MSGPELGELAGVVFDLDGTLYARPLLLGPRVALACGGLGIFRHLSAVRRALAGRSFASEGALWEEHHALLAERSGLTVDQVRRFYEERFMPAFVETLRRHARPRPGLPEQLAQLGARGVVVCVLSDFGQVEARLRALGLAPELFHARASSAESWALKPAPAAFLQLARRFDLPPARWLMVGDRADTDAAGAAAAGMAFLGVRDRPGRAPGFEPWPRLARRLSEVGRGPGPSPSPAPALAAGPSGATR